GTRARGRHGPVAVGAAASAGGAGQVLGGERSGVVHLEPQRRVDRGEVLVHVHLEVQVRAGGVAVGADLADDLARAHALADVDEHTVRVHVDVPGPELLAVDLVLEHDDHAAAAAEAEPGVGDLAGGDGVDRRALGGRHVQTLVLAAPAVAVARGDAVVARQRHHDLDRLGRRAGGDLTVGLELGAAALEHVAAL